MSATGLSKEGQPWIESSDVIPMFPSLVWKIQLEAGLRESLNASIGAALADMRRELRQSRPAVAGSLD